MEKNFKDLYFVSVYYSFDCDSPLYVFSTEEEARKYLNGIKDKDIPVIQDKVKINIQSSKKRRSSTKAISFRVPNEIYNEFIKKVDETGLDKDKILLEMIKEWIE